MPRNAVALLQDGEVKDVTFKVDLPNYGVFDERRVFEPGAAPKVFDNALLGFALTEAVALYALVIALLLLFVF